MRFWKCAALLALALAAFVQEPRAQDYPARPVTFVVPFTPGAATDFLARLLGKKLEERLGKPVVVENRPGAGTVIGSNSVAKAAPDGHTLLMATSTPMAINVSLHKSLPFDPATDFVPLALVAQSPFVLIVNPSLPVKSVTELIALAKEKPGQAFVRLRRAGLAAPSVCGIVFEHDRHQDEPRHLPGQRAGAERCGGRPYRSDVLRFRLGAGHAAGRKGAPARRSPRRRIPAFADIPPINESGVPGFDVAAWFMVVTPGKTPPAVVDKLHAELTRILAMPEIKEQLLKLSLLPMETPPVAEMQSFVKSEIERWGKVVEQAGIKGSQ